MYFTVVFIAAPLMLLTGPAMSPAVIGRRPCLRKMLGGRQAARSLHFLGMAFLAFFTVMHMGLGRTGQVPFARSSASGTWEPVASYSPRRGQAVNSLALTAVGGMLVVPVTAEGKDLETATLVGLLMRSGDAPAGQPWELLEAQGIGGTSWWDARASVVDATTVAVGTWGQAPHLVDLTDRTWQRMEPPTAEHGWDYHFEDGTVYATHSDHADAWASSDRGEHWGRLPH